MPKVSVLVPICNVEKYLDECLASLVNQTLRDIEIICINDGSTDNSLEIIKKFADVDNRIIIIDKSNSGYGDSMNKGLELAQGEFIGILESDDFADIKMYEELYCLAKEKDADLVKSSFYIYSTVNSELNAKYDGVNQLPLNKVISVAEVPELVYIQPSIWSCIYKRELIKNNYVRFLPTSGASYQDTSFAFKTLSLAKRVVLTDKAYVYYRQDNPNSSVKSKNKVFVICEEFEELDKFLSEHAELYKYVGDWKWILQFKTYRMNLMRIADEYKKNFVEKFAETFKEALSENCLGRLFFKKISSKDLDLLVKNPEKYLAKLIEKQEYRKLRKNRFSCRISKAGVKIVFFGKLLINYINKE